MARAQWLAWLLAVAGIASVSDARADDETKETCVTAYHSAQELRLEGKLRQASEQAAICARTECPRVVRNDCTKWLVEIKQSTPTVVIKAKGPAGDLGDVRVFVDDELVASSLDGSAIAIDPGRHTLRFEYGAYAPVTQSIIVATGVRNRPITVEFSAPEPEPEPKPEPKPQELPVAGMVVVGVGVGFAAGFAALAAVGTSQVDDLRDTCGQTQSCAEADIDDAKTKLIVGDVLLGAGIIAAGVGTYLIISHVMGDEAADDSAVRWIFAPSPDGVVAGATVRF